MRTIGPFLPSGRRSASTSSGGSLAGSDSSRRTSATTAVRVRRRDLRLDAVDRLVDEHHVGVAAVGQLEAAVAPHRDHRDPAGGGVQPALPAHGLGRDVERGLQRRVGEPAQALPDHRHVGARHELAARDPQQLATAYGTHRHDRGLGRLGPLEQRLHLRERGLGAQRDERLPQHLHALRLALEQVGGVARGAEDDGEPLGDLALVAQHREVPRRAAQALADPAEAEQPGVRVGRVGEPLQQHRQQRALDVGGARDPARQRLEVAQRGLAGRRSRARPAGPRPPPATAAPRCRAAWRRRRAAGGRRASRAAGAPRGGGGATACRAGRPARRRCPIDRPSRRSDASSSGSTCVRRSWCSWIRCSSVRRKV